MVGCNAFVGDVGVLIGTRIHTYRCTVHYHLVFIHHFGGEVFVGKHTFLRCARYEFGFYTELGQTVENSFRCTTGSQYECFFVLRLQQRLDGLHKADDVRVVTYQFGLSLLTDNLDDIYRTNGFGVGDKFIQIRDNLLLVGNGYVHPCQIGVLQQYLWKLLNAWYLKVYILGIDVF